MNKILYEKVKLIKKKMSGNEFMAEMAAFLRPGGGGDDGGTNRDVTNTALKLKKSKKVSKM